MIFEAIFPHATFRITATAGLVGFMARPERAHAWPILLAPEQARELHRILGDAIQDLEQGR